jgi:hypothetical protein
MIFSYNPEIHNDFQTFEKDFLALNDHYSFLGGVSESEDFLIATLDSSSKKYYHCVFSKNSNETRIGQITIPNTKLVLQSPLNTLNNKFVTQLFPYQILEYKEIIKDYPIFKGLKEEDNPWLVIYSIKKF